MTAIQTEIHKELIESSKSGDSRSQYKLYQLYSGAMFNICYRMMNHKETAEDVLQECFTIAFNRLSSFRYESTFGAWFKRITVNHCINELKKKKTELVLMDDITAKDQSHEEVEEIDFDLKVADIKKAIDQLPDGYRVIFSLYLLEGYDHKEISEILDISESTSKSQYHRAKKKVQETLKSAHYG